MSNQGWPTEVTELISKFSQETGAAITIREPLLQGKSGAFVAIVDCKGQHRDGVYILKVTPVSTEYADEYARHAQAVDIGAFSKSVPPLVGHTQNGLYHLLLMGLAGGSRLEWRPLVDSLRLFGSAYANLVDVLWSSTQFNWTNGVRPSTEIARVLGYRLEREQGGRILDNVSKFLLPDLITSARFVYRGDVLPNPIHFVKYADSYKGHVVSVLRGPVHGDCHSGNVFVRASMNAELVAISLIDLGCFVADSMVFFDHAYFELSTLLHKLETIGEERWGALASALTDDEVKLETLDQIERGWAEDILRGRDRLFARAFESWPDRRDDLKIQFYSAHVSAGLAFLNKVFREGSDGPGLSQAQYQQALVWAAFYLRRLLELWPAAVPEGVRSVPILSARVPAPSRITEEQWRSVSAFDGSGLNVLVLSPSTRQTRSDAVLRLMRINWGLIIDFGVTPVDEEIHKACAGAVRQHWHGLDVDVRLINRGTLWYFANGRQGVSGAEPSQTPKLWRRTFADPLQKLLSEINEHLSPSSVRVLVVHDDLDEGMLLRVCEDLDVKFAQVICPLLLATAKPALDLGDIDLTRTSLDAVLDQLTAMGSPTDAGQNNVALIPRRSGGQVRLDVVPAVLISRVERDLVVIGLHRASQIPASRVFGVDFRRGMVVEWCELAYRLDVARDVFTQYHRALEEKLAASANETVNLLHEPSAGGSTLSRRLAWSLMDRYPAVLIERVSSETADYLRDIFQYCGLPVLVVMEAEVVTESEREALLRQLREDNTRAVFLWVRRSYAKSRKSDVLSGRLSEAETHEFLNAYMEQVSSADRRAALEKLATSEQLKEQRSPFFFGLTAFGENYLGLDRLVTDVLLPMSPQQRNLMARLALASIYTSEGIPMQEFDKMCCDVGLDRRVLESRSFVVSSVSHVRVPHVLIAQRVLRQLARNAQEWKADLRLHAKALLDEVQRLKLHTSNRTRRMIETIFVTRDLVTALEADADAERGSLSRQRRFSPLIADLGSVEIARKVLSQVVNVWPNEPHFSVHYARHLLYEEPKDVEKAIAVATQAAQTPNGSNEHSVVHMVGMCYRVRMESLLRVAFEQNRSFDSVAEQVMSDFQEAVSRFAHSVELQPASEYGHVATIQTVRALLEGIMKVTRQNLPELLATPGRRSLMDALAHAEDHIEQIGQMPRHEPSVRAMQTISEWQLVYGNVDRVISKLRVLAKSYEDTDVRRALCRVIVAKHSRSWTKIPQSDLQTIKSMTERNIESQGVRDADVRIWLKAVRNINGYDVDALLRALVDWHQLRKTAVEPAFYLYCFYFVRWLNSSPTNRGFARESIAWLNQTRANRSVGERSWSYEWLGKSNHKYYLINHADLGFNPISLIREPAPESKRLLDSQLSRVEGTICDYKGPMQAMLDLGHEMVLRFTPQTRIVRDDVGRRASAFVSFGYDGPVGWDVRLSSSR
ncbi:hypothetical protein BE21_35350 [Sorangium cellulosum]|uniref:Uncharacterized protein n=1 Tax=Sorangium cellulosum TaxID=56 RepID=A0A150TNR8_SORCE|nr:hypothetical protein BE21_35350 [Sorangium cellulosum]